MTTYWLSTHLGYGCRHAGACCTAGWPIPIETDRAAAVAAEIESGRVRAPASWFGPAPGAPGDVAGILGVQPSGACVFHRRSPDSGAPAAGGCAIHPVRPVSCEHFPYVCVIDPRGVHVTLSHFCPTAAALLFDSTSPPTIVAGPPVFKDGRLPEGLDARESLPPAAPSTAPRTPHPAPRTAPRTRHAAPSTRVPLLSWHAVSDWEARLVSRVASDASLPNPPARDLFDHARAAVPEPWTWPDAPPDLERGWRALVAPAWQDWAQPIGRYLAARAHASWALYVGRGLDGVERAVDIARTTLQVEAVRRCGATGRPLDRPTLVEAIRQADLLLLHYASPDRLYGP